MIGSKGSRRAVLEYLQQHKDTGITSMEAFEMFGVTRLAAIIHELRINHNIDTVIQESITRFGMPAQYARYYYRGAK